MIQIVCPKLEDIVYSDDDDVGTEADMNNLDAFMHVIPIPTIRIHKDHPFEQIIRDLNSTPQTRRMTKNLENNDSPFDLVAYTDSDHVGASLYRKSTIGGCQFLWYRLISWQCKKHIVVANSITEAEYIAASNCCGQSTICIVKNPVFHLKTKHIEIRHHFIRDSYKKKLIQMIKIHTDQNVADLLTKAFDVSRFQYLIARLGYNAVLPPYTRNFMPPRSDLVYPSLDDFVDESVSESVVKKPTVKINEPETARKENRAPIIKDWVSDSDEENVPKVNTVKGIRVNIARPKAILSAVKEQGKCYYEEIDGGFVAFRGNSKGGKIAGKGKIQTSKLDFKDVYFVKELKFNLCSVSQMRDKKNNVLFTNTECVVLSPDFKLINESHVLLKVSRKDNMYNVDLNNVIPQGGLICLFVKATPDESIFA
ncbi:hypothetical protein Tco_1283863 [Tanacetum coccineum]